jgi:hypothetical protein
VPSYRISPTRCSCGHLLTGASAIEEDVPPSPGNPSICMYCGVLRIYVEDLSLRELTRAELDEVAAADDFMSRCMSRGAAVICCNSLKLLGACCDPMQHEK